MKYVILALLFSTTAFAGKLQNADFATSAYITGAGGAVSQLLNSSKMYNSVDAEIMDTSIARWDANSGSVTSVSASVPSFLSVSGVPITSTGTIAITLATEVSGSVFAGPASGSDAAPTFRALVASDIPALPYQATGSYITALTGDATAAGPGSVPITLATVNGSPGTFGSASNSLTIAVNGKGLVTSAVTNSIQIAEGQVTNLVSDLAGKQAATTDAQEVPSGVIDNANTAFTLAHTPVANASVLLHQDGLLMRQGTDYTISGVNITMTTAPAIGQTLDATYDY